MHLLILGIPLLSTFVSGLFGKWIGGRGSAIISTCSIFITFIISMFLFYKIVMLQQPSTVELNTWFVMEKYDLHWGFLFDTLTCVMLLVVTSISTLVHLYSTEYMNQDPHLSRFMSYLSFFTFFMLILVTGDNLIQMFVGWEGVGLCSYLLINFWYGRLQANKAALKAMIINRIGDFGLAIAIFTVYFYFKNLDYSVIFALSPHFATKYINIFIFEIGLLDFIGFFLFIGAVGKSAQLGLHTWLPDAMEGPTPVSALIHAATMVTAGVFLICRVSPLLEYATNISVIITIIGGMTAFVAATTGLLQNDLKRVIAYSTCSQLGYMIFAAGLSSYSVSVFHLSNHAFFKALLFLGAGSVIHALGDEQDMRKMGGLNKMLPFTYSTILIGSLALMGFPFLTGFYSKDLILEISFGTFLIEGRFVYILGSVAAFFTAYYSIRLLTMTFLRPANGNKYFYEHVHEAPLAMALPLFILSFGSIFIGYMSRDMFVGLGTDFWGNAIYIKPSHQYILEAEWLDTSTKLIPLIFSFSGAFLAWINYNYTFNFLVWMKKTFWGRKLYTFLNRKWFFDKVYNEWISQNLLEVSYKQTYQGIDRGLLEFFGPQGFGVQVLKYSTYLAEYELSFIYHYLVILMCFLILNLIFMISWYYLITLLTMPLALLMLLGLFSFIYVKMLNK